MNKAYQSLLEYSRDLYALRSAVGVLSWDQETMMPPKGGEGRARSMAALSRVMHQRFSDPRLLAALEACAADGTSLSEEERAVVRELRRDRDKTVKVPESLAAEIAETVSLSQRVWAEARPKNDTAAFNPWLEKVITLRRREAECLGYAETPYDALLENYEPGARTSYLRKLLHDLKAELVPLLGRLLDAQGKGKPALEGKLFPVADQRTFNRKILMAMGFDLDAGRLDESAHPFTEGSHPEDVRLTTRYSDHDLMSALFSTLHEGGHGIYEQGFQSRFYGTPMAEAVSLGVHESQSRLWENQVGRSRDFWSCYYPDLQKTFPAQLGSLDLNGFLRAINRVQPSLIRVEADEVTYNLHIVLRFELETALFGGELEAKDLESAWNEGMRRNLGVVPESPSVGYMQDVHWSCGLLGYFPTYTLGNLRAAQLFDSAQKAMPALKTDIRSGAFGALKDWLNVQVHQSGRRYDGDGLMEKVTGSKTEAAPFLAYLRAKYSDLYGITL
ncbi:MAG: Thermostable carboxypeptidase 1 [Fibrobacteres bacterium]|nr:Thermostable carboxypeptidase 1 [Fibrobacterota bacterium]